METEIFVGEEPAVLLGKNNGGTVVGGFTQIHNCVEGTQTKRAGGRFLADFARIATAIIAVIAARSGRAAVVVDGGKDVGVTLGICASGVGGAGVCRDGTPPPRGLGRVKRLE
jgi:hypothetical protein